MAKRVPAPKKPAADSNQQLVDAIVTVKRLQEFIKEHGGVEKALELVGRVHGLIELTGGIVRLTQALEIVGKDDAPA